MSDRPKYFEARVTLGEVLLTVSLLGGFGAFAMRHEGRIVNLEAQQGFTKERLNKLEQVAEKATENQQTLIRLLERTKAP